MKIFIYVSKNVEVNEHDLLIDTNQSKETSLFLLFYISYSRVFNNEFNLYHRQCNYILQYYFCLFLKGHKIFSQQNKAKNTAKKQRKNLDCVMLHPKPLSFDATVNKTSLNAFINSKVNIAFNQPYTTTKIIPNYEYSINWKNHRAHLVYLLSKYSSDEILISFI